MMKRFRASVLAVMFLATMIPVALPEPAAADSPTSDTRCANHAATNDGISGFGLFPHSVSLFPGQATTTTEYMTYVCNGSGTRFDDFTMTRGSGWAWRTNADRSTGRPNALNYSTTGWSGPDAQGYWHQNMGNFMPHTWRSRSVQMGINEAAFTEPGSYWVEIEGKGRIWDWSLFCAYPNMTCYGDTNTITIRLLLRISRPNITCAGTAINPTDPELGESFSVTSNYAATDGSINSIYRLAAYLRDPDGNVVAGGSSVPYTIVNSNSLRYTFPPWTDNTQGGVYTVTTSLSIPGSTWFDPVECSSSFMVAFRPYHKVYGGDVSAGAAFGSPCYDTGARIMGYNLANFAYFGLSVGSGSQLAVSAMSTITEFGSGQARNASDPGTYNVKNLTFANTTTGYGGGLSSTNVVCAQDYWARASGVLSGDQTIAGRNLANGAKQTIYVDGNAYINGNITYTGEPLTGNYNTIANIPSFRLIVRGNIYIAPGVSELNGTFVAIPTNATDGRVYTCSNGFFPPTLVQMNGACKTKLTVYGSVVADLIKFNRGGGSVKDSSANDNYTNGEQAEKFIYTPDTWLTSDFNNSGDINSIKSLPPIL